LSSLGAVARLEGLKGRYIGAQGNALGMGARHPTSPEGAA